MEYNIENYKKAKSSDNFEFICKHCGKTFVRTKRSISKNSGKVPVFCSVECQKEYYNTNCYVDVICKNCGKSKRVTKNEYNKNVTKNFFCDNSCAAIFNNKKRGSDIIWEKNENGKTKRGYNVCPNCGNLKAYTSKLCLECSNKEKRLIKEKTLGYFIEGEKYLTTKCAEIRKDAKRTLIESGAEKVCAYCHNHEFDDILEVHHIKGILEHDKNVKISVINDVNNLVWLCPNHHTMLERGLITLK